jgi:hypothetical protein
MPCDGQKPSIKPRLAETALVLLSFILIWTLFLGVRHWSVWTLAVLCMMALGVNCWCRIQRMRREVGATELPEGTRHLSGEPRGRRLSQTPNDHATRERGKEQA